MDERGTDNRPSALENRFSLIVMQEASDTLSKLLTVMLFRSPTALKRSDRSKQCHCVQVYLVFYADHVVC